MKKQYQDRPQTKFRVEWTDRDKDDLTAKLREVLNFTEIEWEFTDEGLRIEGLPYGNEVITISHPRSARAMLDGYLWGYDAGYGDGNKYRNP